MIEVVFIAGAPRSGSTLLDRLLGQLQGFFSLGELSFIWERGFIENHLCGCGTPFHECPFWTQVVANAYGGFDGIDPEYVWALQRSVARIRHIPRMLYPSLRTRSYQSRFEAYSRYMMRLYRGIASQAKGQVLIDSSKIPSHGIFLSLQPELHLTVIHIVRDSRGVAYSWQRKKRSPQIHWKEGYMAQHNNWYAVGEWMAWNLLDSLLKQRARTYIPVRYEHLAEHPQQVLSDILAQLNKNVALDVFVGERKVYLQPAHTVGGNPMRFKQGEIPIRLDNEWQEKMASWRQHLIGWISRPLEKRIGLLER